MDVVATLSQVAEAQVQQEEQRRIFGVFPNFYTSYIWDPVPLTPKLKFKLALRTTIDPLTLVVVAGIAGAEQYHNTFPGYGQELAGYAKRFGGAYADTSTGRMLGSAILPSILHQDPRYFYRGSGTIRSRALHAIVSTVICRQDNGELEPNYSHILGAFGAAGLSNVYRAPIDRQAGLTFRNLWHARRQIAAWRDEFNQQRPHSSLDYRTPNEFAQACLAATTSSVTQ